MTAPTQASIARPLVVRLRNWVGDVVLGLPTLQRLADAGYDLRLVGKAWACDLLAGHGWPVSVLPVGLGARVALLRTLRQRALADDATFPSRINAVVLPFSFSSALEMRLAGLRAIGHAHEGRRWLLSRSVVRTRGRHELEVYWHLGDALLSVAAPLPTCITLRPSAAHHAQAAALLAARGIGAGYIVICPFAGGTFAGQDKTWPAFADFVAHELPSLGRPVLVCPGPGEETVARERYGHATLLPGLGLGTYAALLSRAALMISNDTGPGHIAAAVAAPVLSVLGPSDAAQWRAWGPTVHIVQGRPPGPSWPSRDEVLVAARALIG